MLIIATPCNPFSHSSNREFKTVPGAIKFMVNSYFNRNGEARNIEVYNGTAPVIRFDFNGHQEIILKSGIVDGMTIDHPVSLDNAVLFTKTIHKEA